MPPLPLCWMPKLPGKVVIKDVIADAFLQNTLLVPEEYSVIATLNLNGDYVSDQLAAMVGGIGIAPGATSTTTAAMRSSRRHMDGTQHCRQERRESLLAFTFFRHDARIYGMERGRSLITAALEHAFSEGRPLVTWPALCKWTASRH